ncbi:MAG: Crp/Fnr family transcriptional regulator [Bacteroidales bacterium]|nr:Crp/Fnr family transcriptional regulator [Bacteroidales bacterium]
MNRYFEKTNCNECNRSSDCFIQNIEKIEEFYNLQKIHINYKKGETIIKEGSRVSNILYVLDGLVKTYIEGPERNIIIKLLKPGDFLGLTSLFGDDTYYFSAAALKETKVCSIDREGIKDLISQSCDFSRETASWYCKNYNIMLTKCLNLGLRQLHGKLANTLLYLNREEFKSIDVFSYITRKDLAELSGMAIESVARILSEFSDEKIIELNRKKIEIKNLELLKSISKNG